MYRTLIRMPFDKLASIHAFNCKALPDKFPLHPQDIKEQMSADLVNVAKTGIDLKDEDSQWVV